MSSNKWQKTTLDSVVNILSGGTPSTRVPEYWSNEIKWATAKDVSESSGYKIYDTDRKISKLGLENSPANIIPKDATVLIARGATMGRCCMLGEDMAINQTCFALAAKEGKIHPYFLFYSIKNLNDYFQKIAHGAIFNTVIGSGLRETEISLPPLPTQRRIADILSALDEKIELNRQTNATLEAIAQSVFREWFVANEDLEKWQEIDLPEAIDFLEGPGIRNWQYTNSDEGIRFINIRCIQNRDINTETANRINENDVNTKYQHFLLRQDDIVVSTSGTLGRFGIIRDEHLPLLLNTSVIRMRPVEGVTTWSYLIGYIESEEFQFELATRATGSVQKNFGPMHLKQMKIKIPPIELLIEFEKVAEPLHRKMIHNFSESATLSSLRDTLLPKLMSGEIEL